MSLFMAHSSQNWVSMLSWKDPYNWSKTQWKIPREKFQDTCCRKVVDANRYAWKHHTTPFFYNSFNHPSYSPCDRTMLLTSLSVSIAFCLLQIFIKDVAVKQISVSAFLIEKALSQQNKGISFIIFWYKVYWVFQNKWEKV